MPKGTSLVTIIISFAIAIFVIFLLSKFKAKWFLKIWFFAVVVLALGITLYALFFYLKIPYGALIALLIALPLAIYKIFKQHILIHNLTELMIYPGIAAVFVPILNVWTIIILLIAISIYDIWAVWHAGFMQKMAKFQIQQLKLFAGFFVPSLGSKQRAQIRAIKLKYKYLDAQLIKSKILINNFDYLTGKEKYKLVRNLIAIYLFIKNKKISEENLENGIKKNLNTNAEDIKNNLIKENSGKIFINSSSGKSQIKEDFVKKYKNFYHNLEEEIIKNAAKQEKTN